MRAYYDLAADLLAIDLRTPPDGIVDTIDLPCVAVLVTANGEPRSVEVTSVAAHGVDTAISAIVDRWPSLSRVALSAAAHAAIAAPDAEVDVTLSAAA